MKNLLTVSNGEYIRLFLYLRFVPAVGYAMITLPNLYTYIYMYDIDYNDQTLNFLLLHTYCYKSLSWHCPP